MFIDGTQVILNDGLHGMSEAGATVTLTAGYHDIRAEMFENGGAAGAILRWQTAARGVKVADVTRAYEALYATDVAIKSGRVDSDAAALTLCVLDLCGVRAARMTDLLDLPVARR